MAQLGASRLYRVNNIAVVGITVAEHADADGWRPHGDCAD